jgi:hypothetical protein
VREIKMGLSIIESVAIYGLFLVLFSVPISYIYNNQNIYLISIFIFIFVLLLAIICVFLAEKSY